MKSHSWVLVLIAGFFLLAFTKTQKHSNPLFEDKLEDIGTIKQSILKPEDFNRTQKGTWVLMDGRELESNTDLHNVLDGSQNLNFLKDGRYLPNALGKFIRCSNYRGKGSDPDSLRPIATIQSDTIQVHQHGYGGNFLNNDGNKIWDAYGTRTTNQPWAAKNNNGRAHNSNRLSLTAPEGGIETRPINISLYTYIKIKQ